MTTDVAARAGRTVATLCAVERTWVILRGGRRVSALAGAAVAGALLAGCSAGFDATSTQPYAPADGLYAESGTMRALNVLVVADDTGSSGVLVMTLVNRGDGDDRLTDVESSGGTVSLSGPADLPAGEALRFSNDTEPTVTFAGLTALAGEAIEVTLRFADAQPITVNTVVVPADGDYAGITPAPSESASLTP